MHDHLLYIQDTGEKTILLSRFEFFIRTKNFPWQEKHFERLFEQSGNFF
jgi:hypothetical protein